jgi:hypothetical protein
MQLAAAIGAAVGTHLAGQFPVNLDQHRMELRTLHHCIAHRRLRMKFPIRVADTFVPVKSLSALGSLWSQTMMLPTP